MTNQEAIEDIKSCIGCGIYEETANVAISALEKQIPKKPIDNKNFSFGNVGICPCCNEDITTMYSSKVCTNCGQAIDWSEKE